jgi:hypothetical protein
MKVDTDAAFDADSAVASGGVVIRNENGQLLAARARRHCYIADVLTAETIAARDGLLLAAAQGYERIIWRWIISLW